MDHYGGVYTCLYVTAEHGRAAVRYLPKYDDNRMSLSSTGKARGL